MERSLTIKGVTIGKGLPKICVPMVGKTVLELIDEANFLKDIDLDFVEWRVDFFENVTSISKVKEALHEIRMVLGNKPIIFTFRSAKEGGEQEISTALYVDLNVAIAETKQIDIIDVELFNDEIIIKELTKAAHRNGVRVIVSNHDFHKTPTKEEIIARLCRAFELGGDISKIAVMPTCAADVITLLDATRIMHEEYDKGPIITMSMSGKGVISRLSGELFGSSLSFGAARKASAPGQISVADLRKTIQLLHDNLLK